MIEGKPLLVFGDGRQIRDFNYVDDVVDALLFAALSEDANGEIFNLGADDPITLKDTAELMIAVNGSGTYEIVPFPQDRKVIDIGDYYGDYRKILSKLAWKPKTPLADGLKKSLDYFSQYSKFYWDEDHAS
jgi:nucleoside-diphosphate-sugar epimerase